MLSLIQHLEKPDQPSLKTDFFFKQTEGSVTKGIFILLHENAICNLTYFALVEYISTTFDVILITRNHEGINEVDTYSCTEFSPCNVDIC